MIAAVARPTAILSGFFSSILSTFATFLPMKSVLILATGEVPGFFPWFLSEQGPLGVALILLVAAGFFSGLSALANHVLSEISNSRRTAIDTRGTEGFFGRTINSNATALLVLVIAVFLSYISWVFTVLLLVWISGLSLFIRFQDKVANENPSSASGDQQFLHRVSEIMKQAALWSTVSCAVLTLVLSEPRLGLTGILLATVFGRKLQLGIGVLIMKENSGRARSSHDDGGFSALTGSNSPNNLHPLNYFSTPKGLDVLGSFLSARGIGARDFQIQGTPGQRTVGILAGIHSSEHLFLYRIFQRKLKENASEEVYFRNGAWPVSPYKTPSARLNAIAGFPMVELKLTREPHLITEIEPPGESDIEFWLERLEVSCLRSHEFQSQPRPRSSSDLGEQIVGSLERFAVLPGIYQQKCRTLLPKLRSIYAEIAVGPVVWVPRRRLRSGDFFKTGTDTFELIGFPGWSIGLLGENWVRRQPTSQTESVFLPYLSDVEWASARIRANSFGLVFALENNNPQDIEKHLGSLQKNVDFFMS